MEATFDLVLKTANALFEAVLGSRVLVWMDADFTSGFAIERSTNGTSTTLPESAIVRFSSE